MTGSQIGLSMLYLLGEPFEKTAERLQTMETAYIELVDDGLQELTGRRVLALKEISSSYGKKYSVHAPFADVNIASPSKPLLKAMFKRLEQSISSARALEAYLWIFHPGIKTGISMFYPNEDWQRNLKTANALAKLAKDYGVKIAIENVPEPYPFLMKSVEDFKRFYAEANEHIGLVLDVGHSNLNGQTEFFVKIFGDRIVHVHASDNYGKTDQHLGIGNGNIQWDRLLGLLNETSYNKAIVVESVEQAEESVRRLEELMRCKWIS